jgi:hypothetical protein
VAAEIYVFLLGFLPLGLAIATSLRWLRVVLALVACGYFALCVASSLFVSDGMRAHGVGLTWSRAMFAVVFAISALSAFALVFVPTRSRDYESTKQFSSSNEDLTPKS